MLINTNVFFTELNSTSPSSNEFGELTNDLESDELSADNEGNEDVAEDILYMRGVSFTIHLEPEPENSSINFTRKEELKNEIPEGTQLRPTSTVSIKIMSLSTIVKKSSVQYYKRDFLRKLVSTLHKNFT